MSREDDLPPCAECGQSWGAGVHDYAHPYKEPARVEAPQGERIHRCLVSRCERLASANDRYRCPVHSGKPVGIDGEPAAQPETGGDEGMAEIVERLNGADWEPFNMGATVIKVAREAYAAGRAAENEACEAIAAHEESIGTGTAEFISTRIRHAIAARRGRGE